MEGPLQERSSPYLRAGFAIIYRVAKTSLENDRQHETLSCDVRFLLGNCVEGVSKICLRLDLGNTFYTSLRKGDSHLKQLTSTIPWLTPTHAISPSHMHLCPPCGSLPSTARFSTRTRPIGSGYFRAKPFSV